MQNVTKNSSGLALLLVDIQHDFITGSLAVQDAERILPVVKNLIESHSFDMIIASQVRTPVIFSFM
jgi:nicotinamidase-related amidase